MEVIDFEAARYLKKRLALRENGDQCAAALFHMSILLDSPYIPDRDEAEKSLDVLKEHVVRNFKDDVGNEVVKAYMDAQSVMFFFDTIRKIVQDHTKNM